MRLETREPLEQCLAHRILSHSQPLLSMLPTLLTPLDRQRQKGHFNSCVHVCYSGGCFCFFNFRCFFFLSLFCFVCLPGLIAREIGDRCETRNIWRHIVVSIVLYLELLEFHQLLKNHIGNGEHRSTVQRVEQEGGFKFMQVFWPLSE